MKKEIFKGLATTIIVATFLTGCGGTTYAPGIGGMGQSSNSYIQTMTGRIIKAQMIEVQDDGVGTIVGAVAGGVLGHQVGGGHGKDIATVVGAVGGAYTGNQLNKSQGMYLEIQTNTGIFKTQTNMMGFRVGDTVSFVLNNGNIENIQIIQ